MNQGLCAQCWEPGKLSAAPVVTTGTTWLPCWPACGMVLQGSTVREMLTERRESEAWKAAALAAGQEHVIPLIHLLFPLPIMPAASLASQGGGEDSLVNVCEALYRWRELCKC